MNKFIILTAFDGSKTVVNLNKVTCFETVTKNSGIYTSIRFEDHCDSILVKENCELIYKIINS